MCLWPSIVAVVLLKSPHVPRCHSLGHGKSSVIYFCVNVPYLFSVKVPEQVESRIS